jgi:hypothetical protein
MEKYYRIVMVLVLLTLSSLNTFGDDTTSQGRGDRRLGPPPEAYTACEGKNAGDTAEFVMPQGDTINGTCVQEGDKLVLRPDNFKGGPHGRVNGPPPEAIEVCEGKSAGDSAEFVTEQGDTIIGTCEQHGDKLVLRPDRPQQ